MEIVAVGKNQSGFIFPVISLRKKLNRVLCAHCITL